MKSFATKLRLPSPALLVSILALVVAGVGTAAALPGKNTVNSGDIKNGQVQAGDLGAINTRTDVEEIANNSTESDVIGCEEGEILLGGGADFEGNGDDRILVESFKTGENSWAATGTNTSGGALDLTVQAYCLQK